MPQLVTIKQGDFYYVIPMHEFSRYWINEPLEVVKLPKDIPMISKMTGLERGKSYKRTVKAYEQKGSGNHATNRD
jgi:hypothetical protein